VLGNAKGRSASRAAFDLPSAEFILWDPRAWNSPEQATAKLELVGRNPGYVFTEGQGCDDSQRGQGAAVRG